MEWRDPCNNKTEQAWAWAKTGVKERFLSIKDLTKCVLTNLSVFIISNFKISLYLFKFSIIMNAVFEFENQNQ